MIANEDVADVYLVPAALQEQGLDDLVCREARPPRGQAELGEWHELTERIAQRDVTVEIALVGKYVKLHDAYLSVHEALKHAGIHHGCHVQVALGRRRGHVARGGAARAREGRRRARSRRLRLARLGGEDPRLPRRPRARDPVPRHLPRHARRRLRVRPSRRRARGRELDGDGSGDAVPGDRPAARAEGGRGSRRHDAARRAGGRDRRGHAHRTRPTASR